MAKIGLLGIEDVNWDDFKGAIESLLLEKGKDKADRKADFCDWYAGEAKGVRGNKIIEKYIPITYVTRKKVEERDLLTDEVYTWFSTNVRSLSIVQSKYYDGHEELYLIAQEGTASAVTDFSKALKLKVSMRRRISFNEDFLEYLNTAVYGDRGYSNVFKDDMISVRRKGRQKKHMLDERYPEPTEREQHIGLQFREAAGVKITPPNSLAQVLPTMLSLVYKNDWISLSQPSLENGETIFYEGIIYAYHRLLDAFDSFQSIY